MKIISVVLISVLLLFPFQDGSDIRYVNVDQLDESFVGNYCHIDFGQDSYLNRNIDTMNINVQGKLMRFYEHRKDDGYNNWFNQQYLIRTSDVYPSQARLESSKIDSITADKIYVTSMLSYYNYESVLDTVTIFQHHYDKKDVAKVLIKVERN